MKNQEFKEVFHRGGQEDKSPKLKNELTPERMKEAKLRIEAMNEAIREHMEKRRTSKK